MLSHQTCEPPTEGVLVQMSNGEFTRVDPDIAEWLRGRRVHKSPQGYAVVYFRGQVHPLHRLIVAPPAGRVVDHIDNDKLDNLRANIRAVTRTLNTFRGHRKVGVSGFRGVYAQRSGKWLARMEWEGRRYSGHAMHSPLLAALERDDIVRQVTGQEEGLVFPLWLESRDVRAFLSETFPQPFTVWFVTRGSGAIRRLNGVWVRRPNLPFEGDLFTRPRRALPFNPARRRLAGVWDIEKNAFRFIPLENVLCLRYRDKNYRIRHCPSRCRRARTSSATSSAPSAASTSSPRRATKSRRATRPVPAAAAC